MDLNRRRFSRTPFQTKIELTVNEQVYHADTIINLSIGGCLLPIIADLKEKIKCDLVILLDDGGEGQQIRVKGRIIRCDSNYLAIRFILIEPDSLFHLQNIILYNFPDTDKVEKEIQEHPGIK